MARKIMLGKKSKKSILLSRKSFWLLVSSVVVLLLPIISYYYIFYPNPRAATPAGIALGVYVPATAGSYGTSLDAYSSTVGKMPAVAWFPIPWQNQSAQYIPFSAISPHLDEISSRGVMAGVNWQPQLWYTGSVTQPSFNWQAIISGQHDAYITQWATDAKTYGKPFYIRMMHEMNGNWYPWAYGVNGNTNPADYVAAWQHIVTIFHQVGATNVGFVWCVSTGGTYTNYKSLYPGDAYVDWIAMDGYNSDPQKWLTFYNRFSPTYAALAALTTKPMAIWETASVENPNDATAKATWITQGFLSDIPTSFPRVKAVLWFDVDQSATGGPNWTINTSQNSLNAFKQVVINPYYQGVFSPPGTQTPTNAPTIAPASPTPTLIPPLTSAPSYVPTVIISNPVNQAVITRKSTITISAQPTDNSPVSNVEFYVNNQLVCLAQTYPYNCQWNVPAKPNQLYAVVAKVYDTTGKSATASISVTAK